GSDEFLDAHRLDRVGVAHETDRSRAIGFSEFSDQLQDIREADPMLERAFAGALDHRAVGHRVREGNAELDDGGAGLDQRAHERHRERGVRIARGDIGNERLALVARQSLEPALNARHQSFVPERSATVCMSLSPRPERLTRRIASFFIAGAIFIACATACADSSAGMMPSVRHSSWKALSACSSSIATYSARLLSLSQACSGPTPG